MKSALSKRRFKKYLKMTRDESERILLEKSYPDTGKRRRFYMEPGDEAQQKHLKNLLKKLKKASSKLLWTRLTIAAILIAGLIVFNVVFLDSILRKRTESLLEFLTLTDVGIAQFDIQLFRGKLSIGELSFASLDDPMIDRARFDNILVDFDIPALIRRRVIVEGLKGHLAINAPRQTPARYPATGGIAEKIEDKTQELSSMDFNTDWIPRPELPENALSLAGELRQDAEDQYEKWTEAIENQINETANIARRVEKILGESLDKTLAIGEWIVKIDEANRLINDVKTLKNETEIMLRDAVKTAGKVSESQQSIIRALESDLTEIEKTLRLDSAFINTFLQAAITEYSDPWVGKLFSYYQRYKEKIAEILPKKREKKPASDKAWKRLKRGRIVSFPVDLPPRFMVKTLDLGGLGVEILGRSVGIDHELIGMPSTISLKLKPESGFPASLDAAVAYDDRVDAQRVLKIEYRVSDIAANIAGLSSELGFSGIVDSSDIADSFAAQGRASMRSWKGTLQADAVSLDLSNAPMLGLSYKGEFSGTRNQMEILPAGESIADWAKFLGAALLPQGVQAAREALENAIGSDLEALMTLSGDWESLTQNLAVQIPVLNSLEEELFRNIEVWKDRYLPKEVPSDAVDKVIGGLKSLFN